MALDKQVLSSLIVSELEAKGFVASGDHSYAQDLADAIAAAVVAHVQAYAEVTVDSGSSAGTYPVE